MKQYLKTGSILIGLLTLLTGVVYPLVVTGLAQLCFTAKANGSLITDYKNNKVVGSILIGQTFSKPEYFWGRPTREALPPSSPLLVKSVGDRINDLHRYEPVALIPNDLVLTSASMVDPHISPQAAFYQVKRIASIRHLPEDTINTLIYKLTSNRTIGILGEPRINVVQLNYALDTL